MAWIIFLFSVLIKTLLWLTRDKGTSPIKYIIMVLTNCYCEMFCYAHFQNPFLNLIHILNTIANTILIKFHFLNFSQYFTFNAKGKHYIINISESVNIYGVCWFFIYLKIYFFTQWSAISYILSHIIACSIMC